MKSGRDLRIQKFEPRHLHSLMAFTPWLQAARTEVEAGRETNPNADKVFRDFLTDLSKELLGWIDAWRCPAVEEAKAVV
jgi:hypothetical protein